MRAVIVDYGGGNTFSLIAALRRLGVEPELSDDGERIATADRIIIPGVGHAGRAMSTLRAKALLPLLRSVRQPVLGICLGLQLLASRSAEGNTECLDLINGEVRRFEPNGKVPHLGWNVVRNVCSRLLPEKPAYFYFVHSYILGVSPHTSAECVHNGVRFTAAAERGNFFGVQFHPERSGRVGAEVLRKFLES